MAEIFGIDLDIPEIMAESLDQALLRISKLEEKIEDQQIVIDALVGHLKRLKKGNGDFAMEKDDKEEAGGSCMRDPRDMRRFDLKRKGVEKGKDDKISLSDEVEGLFRGKKGGKPFKDAFTLDSLLSYSRESHSFSLNTKAGAKMKKTLHTSIKQQGDKIIKHLIANLNVYDLNTICSTLSLISGDLEYQHKTVVAHDVILFIDDFSRMPFVISALFNNQGLHDDVLGGTLKEILRHQCLVDGEIYKDHPHLPGYYSRIVDNFEIQGGEKSLADICVGLVGNFKVFEEGVFNSMIFPNMYSIRALCHYMDWDYTYNEFVCSVLYPRVKEARDALSAIYMFVVAFNALRVFGDIESVRVVFERLKETMSDASELSAVVYLFIKQVDPARAEAWYELQTWDSKDVDGECLRDLLLY